MNKAKTENQDVCRFVLHGRVRPLRGHEAQLAMALSALLKALRRHAGIRGVYPEWISIS